MNRLMRVNVETSSYYALPRFLCEVERVLRPGGFLLYADVRYGRDRRGEIRDVSRYVSDSR
jgi:hypothetical protein